MTPLFVRNVVFTDGVGQGRRAGAGVTCVPGGDVGKIGLIVVSFAGMLGIWAAANLQGCRRWCWSRGGQGYGDPVAAGPGRRHDGALNTMNLPPDQKQAAQQKLNTEFQQAFTHRCRGAPSSTSTSARLSILTQQTQSDARATSRRRITTACSRRWCRSTTADYGKIKIPTMTTAHAISFSPRAQGYKPADQRAAGPEVAAEADRCPGAQLPDQPERPDGGAGVHLRLAGAAPGGFWADRQLDRVRGGTGAGQSARSSGPYSKANALTIRSVSLQCAATAWFVVSLGYLDDLGPGVSATWTCRSNISLDLRLARGGRVRRPRPSTDCSSATPFVGRRCAADVHRLPRPGP